MVDFRSIPAFCINLDSRPDRWEKVRGEFSKLNWAVNRVSASVWNPNIISGLRRGPAACMESHRSVWRLIADHPCEVAAVFEDDAVFPSDFEEIFADAYSELPENWKVWHLHSFGPPKMKTPKNIGVYVTELTGEGWGSHGYLIKKSFAAEALRLSFEVKNQPVDMLLTRGVVNKGFCSCGICIKHTLCFQLGEDTDIPETKQNDYWATMRIQYCR